MTHLVWGWVYIGERLSQSKKYTKFKKLCYSRLISLFGATQSGEGVMKNRREQDDKTLHWVYYCYLDLKSLENSKGMQYLYYSRTK